MTARIVGSNRIRIACQVILGTAGGYFGVFLWANLFRPSSMIAALAIYAIVFVAPAIVVYVAGRLGKQNSSYPFTLLGGFIGLLAGFLVLMGLTSLLSALGYAPG